MHGSAPAHLPRARALCLTHDDRGSWQAENRLHAQKALLYLLITRKI